MVLNVAASSDLSFSHDDGTAFRDLQNPFQHQQYVSTSHKYWGQTQTKGTWNMQLPKKYRPSPVIALKKKILNSAEMDKIFWGVLYAAVRKAGGRAHCRTPNPKGAPTAATQHQNWCCPAALSGYGLKYIQSRTHWCRGPTQDSANGKSKPNQKVISTGPRSIETDAVMQLFWAMLHCRALCKNETQRS